MKITHFGHSSILFEQEGARILFDPGRWSEGFENVKELDAICITHQHGDHISTDHMKVLLANNPEVRVLTNHGVGEMLTEAEIAFELFEAGAETEIKGVSVQAFGDTHAHICDGIAAVHNTGFILGGTFYHPGDSFIEVPEGIDVLALPVCAPWMASQDCVDFLRKVKPKYAFPIHFGMLKHREPFFRVPSAQIEAAGAKWEVFEEGESREF